MSASSSSTNENDDQPNPEIIFNRFINRLMGNTKRPNLCIIFKLFIKKSKILLITNYN